MRFAAILLALAVPGCSGGDDAPPRDGGVGDSAVAVSDAPTSMGSDASTPDGGTTPTGIAPEGTIPGELPATGTSVPVSATPSAPMVVRIEALPNEHVTFFLAFEGTSGVELEVLRWDGAEPVALGLTDAGPELRTLAAFDPSGPRTFWARVTTSDPSFDGTLTITRVPFEDAATCEDDCAHLLQLPLPNEVATDGYRHTSSTVFRYQYGRRDLVMFLRHAGRTMVGLGHSSFVPEDLSQWNGETPGTDVGAPRHASHQRGKDVDVSLYGADGTSTWRSYCDAVATGDGRECAAGTEHDLDGVANAIFFGDFLATGRVTMSFLDQELHPTFFAGADTAAAMGTLEPSLVPLFSDGVHVQHWPNHDNHIHIRVSEVDGASTFFLDLEPAAFEPP